ncbi:multicopper oxidase domain-containing protein [Halorubellus sp. PRR65]|uniref:multicopper oxidase domain-containing protein n=1 Tax=Halorubellus sp. PRR65 TaxID=3098148 RepID=UPI002B26241A|nr:multicopper oxidase domain-containing protein [Halorubellus sp. PRR65]
MTDRFGAPGTGVSRREFVAATGGMGAMALAGCTTAFETDQTTTTTNDVGSTTADLPETSPPEVVNVDEQGGSVTVKSQPAVHKPHPGDAMGGPVELPRVWAFSADDGDPSVPGPIIRTTEGEDMEVTLDNTDGKRPHTIHFHGVTKQWKDDGVPTSTGIRVDPGEKHTYDIPANVPGTHIYHCHYQTQRHIEMGMWGIFRVDPKGYEPADKEYFLGFRETDSSLSRQMAGEDASYDPRNRNPDTFMVNGKCAPRTLHPEDGSPVIVEQGDTVRLHMANGGYMSHPMHIHNHRFKRIEKDGGKIPEAAQHEMDVTNMAPAERHTIEFEADADPGIYLMHCHKVNHVMNGSFYPGGMLGGVVYKDAMDTDIFKQLMEYAGYEG